MSRFKVIVLGLSALSLFAGKNASATFFRRGGAFCRPPAYQMMGRAHNFRPIVSSPRVVYSSPLAYPARVPVQYTPPSHSPTTNVPTVNRSRPLVTVPNDARRFQALFSLNGLALLNQAKLNRDKLEKQINEVLLQLAALQKKGIQPASNLLYVSLSRELARIKGAFDAYRVIADLDKIKGAPVEAAANKRKNELVVVLARMELASQIALFTKEATPLIKSGRIDDMRAALTTAADKVKRTYSDQNLLAAYNQNSIYLSKNAAELKALPHPTDEAVIKWGEAIPKKDLATLRIDLQRMSASWL